MLEIFLHGGMFAGCVPVWPTRCEKDHISKVNQLIMNKFTQPVLILLLFPCCWLFLCTAVSVLKQLFDHANNEL